ncbi:Linoleate 13S-lipoxygenase 2-1 [Morus notabilis]|uniref:Lipoxygenase n=1 Tax=Morus notabilis TaxID=981085 RepID=W9QY99_9ROSA|nr:linoleate 13S-lipoxygenase 2-1, chloroplastic [Morus notabilis]EXB28966.1 Linoleate 13S-lipoxygenase 2-1 [Morus notabilis]
MMLKPCYQVGNSSNSTQIPFHYLLRKPFVLSRPNSLPKRHETGRIRFSPAGTIKAVASSTSTDQYNEEPTTSDRQIETETITVKAVVTVQPTVTGFFKNLGIDRGLDDIQDLLGKSLLLELVSAELDPKTGLEKETVEAYAHKIGKKEEGIKYETSFEVPIDFGEIGAVLVENEHHKEMYLTDIVLDGLPDGPVTVICCSWVHSKFDNPEKRLFFTSKSYLPSQTPSGLRRLREEELANLRGDGEGQRKHFERIYDYDVYNDIGDPDKNWDLQRPVLGCKDRPYPRRCRTGRPRSESDPSSEKRSRSFYVPRDECFSEIKQLTFSAKTLYSVLHALSPSLATVMVDRDLGFPYFTAIDALFSQGVDLPPIGTEGFLQRVMPRVVKTLKDSGKGVLRFEAPETVNRDKFFWFRDEEFARQTLSGLNPCSLRLITEWPIKSKLDPLIYGPEESAITEEMIKQEIGGIMSVDEAIKKKKLFTLDYHDLLIPFVHKVRELKGTTLYGSRTVFFLNPDGTLRPLAIELTRPPHKDKPLWRQVFTPCWHSTGVWLWRIAKAHVLAHDSGYHQLVSHWLRTHCVAEPYVIATNRQLSVMHPIYRLLHPHFRYTMEINALAREALINADGTIETAFTPGKYSVELSSAAYGLEWQFDLQALPADLINRGMAVEDPNAPHGLKLTIKDYPYANDGLMMWDCIKKWITDYVNHYYPDSKLVESDQELQAWWTEIRTVGHADKKDEPWWPVLKTPKDLIEIITTIVWVTSGYHAAVNFGQYAYAGYFPNRPTIARSNMPTEDPTDEEWQKFIKKPESALLKCFPSQLQATRVMAVLDILSNHSPDEEYLGEKIEQAWADDPVIKEAFERFNKSLKVLELIIDSRNENTELKNRNGAGIVPYELLKPFSKPGVTGKGVPYSISI